MVIDTKKLPGYDRFPIRIKGLNCWKNVHKAFQTIRDFYKLQYFSKNYRINIIQIGAGGTGGYVFAEMMRYLSNLPKPLQYNIHYTICDGDVFEAKNIKRQLCSEEDIGKNKAECLVEKCTETYDNLPLTVQAYPKYINNIRQLQMLSFGLPYVYIRKPRLNVSTYDYKDTDEQVFIRNKIQECFYKDDITSDMEYYANFLAKKYVHVDDDGNVIDTTELKDAIDSNKNWTSYDILELNKGRQFSNRLNTYRCIGETYCNHNFTNDNTYELHIDQKIFPFLDVSEYEEDISFNITDIYVIPIIIDCVDKTTVREIINSLFKMYNYLPSISSVFYENIINSIENLSQMSNNFHFEEETIKEISEFMNFSDKDKYSIGLTGIDSLTFLKKKEDGTDCISAFTKNINYNTMFHRYNDAHMSVFNSEFSTSVKEMYLISSGNGEYTGQVGWGRLCNYINTSKPICYKDIFGNNERPGSILSKDQGEDETILEKEFVENLTVNDYRTGMKYKNATIPYRKVTDSFCLSKDYSLPDDFVLKYFKNLYKFEKGFNKALTEKTKDTSLTSCILDYYKEINLLDIALLNDHGCNYPLGKCFIDGSEREFSQFVDYHVTLPRNYNKAFISLVVQEATNFSSNIDSLTGNIIPWEYKNFDDWIGQYLSVPIPYSVFPELVDIEEDLKEEQMSCAQRAVENVQSMQANKTAANLVVNFAIQILEGLTNGGSIIPVASVYFDTRENTYVPTYITTDYLKKDNYEIDPTSIDVVYRLKSPKDIYKQKKLGEIHEISI